ncbi:unnamed protein product [Symbiodinium microadriaticum]|nr:unnamed protein product [Symbiodinium microadriaticum]
MSMTVTVTFLSGQMVPVVVQTDASADELKSRVQHACQVGIRDIVSQQGKLVQGSDKLCDKGVQDGDVLTATVHGTRIITRFASLEYPTGPAKWGSVFAAIRHDGHVLCWGNQRQGTSYKRVQEKLVHVLEIAATEEAFAATLADGSVVTWGDSEGGGDSSAVQDQLVSVRLIKATAAAFAALRADGHVVTWGCESFGGDSAAVQKDLQDVVAISTTEGAFAAKRSNGTVVTWGRACDGGDSRTVQHLLREVQQITACAGAFAALCSTAELVVWGSTQAKMLRSVRAVRASWGSFAAIRLDGSVVTCGQAADGGDSSGVQELLVGVQEIQASASAFAALRSDGRVVAWGDEENGSDCTAVQTQLQNVRQLRSTWSAFAALRLDGRVVTWGSLDDGADISSIEEELVDVVEVVATAAAFAALRSDGSVVTWGDAEYGGDCSMVQQQLQNVNEITASWRAFAAIRADGLIVAWGNPEDGGDTSLVQDDLASFRYGDEKGARNMSHALGDCYADDWAIPDAFRVASVLLRQVQSGSVAVLHMPQRGFRQHTLEVLRHFLQGLAQRQLRAVTLSQLADAALLGQKPAPGGAEDNEGQFSQSNHHRIGVLLALLATSFLCWPQQPRRLLTLSLSWSSSPLDAGWVTAENPGEDFNRWMSNAGLAATSQQGPVSLRDRLALRILAFAVDVLPPSVLQDYEDELSQAKGPLQVSGIDLAAKRPLTQSEEMIKEALAQQASSGEPLASSGGYSYWGFLPKFVDRVFPNRTTVTWSSRCWQQITASTVKSNGGWVLQVKVSKAKHVLCNEIFGFFTGAHFRVGSFPAPIGGTKTFTFDSEKLTESQIWDVDTLGIRVFTFQENPLATVRNILETALLFVPDQTRGVESYFAKRNVEFLRNYVGASLKPRKDPGGLLLNASDIRSGDFLGVLRLDGLDPMLAWGMGSHTGHTAVAIWEHGQLYVAESTINSSYWPTNGIQRTPYQQWIEQDVGCRTAPFLSLLSLLFWRPSVLNRGAYPLPPCAAFSPPLLNEDLGKTALFSPTASQGRPRCATQHEGVHYSLFLGEYPDRGLYVIGVLTFYELDPIPPGEYLERGLPVRKVHDSGQDKEGAIHKLCASYHGGHNRDVNDPAQGAANAFFHKYEGLEYGYHAMLTGWIDTLRCKPPYDTPEYEKQCLTWEFIEVAVPIITRYIPTLEKPFLLTWNQHVTGSSFSNLSATALYREARSKGMELGKIPAVPEPDGILYPSVFNNGTRAASIAMVCDVFVCSMWKAGGVFKAIDNDFSCIEQTNVESQLQSDLRVQGMLLKDVYDLNVLEAPSARKDTCVHADPENPLCQLTGVYGLELPKLGTRPMYRHMCLGNLDPGVL